MSPEEELALNVKVEIIVNVAIQLTAALIALRKAVDRISHQPTLQMDRAEIGKELAETVDRINKSLASLERLFARREPDG